jgi:hypothetical protein
MGASYLIWSYKPLYRPHLSVGCWGLSSEFIGSRLNKKGLVFKAFRMFSELFGTKFGGGGGNRTRVRKLSTFGSTCLAKSFDLTVHPPTGKMSKQLALSFSSLVSGRPHCELVSYDPSTYLRKIRLYKHGR